MLGQGRPGTAPESAMSVPKKAIAAFPFSASSTPTVRCCAPLRSDDPCYRPSNDSSNKAWRHLAANGFARAFACAGCSQLSALGAAGVLGRTGCCGRRLGASGMAAGGRPRKSGGRCLATALRHDHLLSCVHHPRVFTVDFGTRAFGMRDGLAPPRPGGSQLPHPHQRWLRR